MASSESDYDDSDLELQEAFAKGLLKPGLNQVEETRKPAVNNVSGIAIKLQEFKQDLPWVEVLDSINKQAPLAPELAVKLLEQEQKLENQKRNNKKLIHATVDPVLDDFKREMGFYRQAQAAVISSIPKLHALGIKTKRPEDYFSEMSKSDVHMQKVRQNLLKKQNQQQMVEKVKQLRTQRKEGKAIQIQNTLKRQQEKKQLLHQIKNVRKGLSNNLDFLNNKKEKGKTGSKKSLMKRQRKNDKFGFGGKKKGLKLNTRESASNFDEYKKGGKSKLSMKGNKSSRPGKSKRVKIKNRK